MVVHVHHFWWFSATKSGGIFTPILVCTSFRTEFTCTQFYSLAIKEKKRKKENRVKIKYKGRGAYFLLHFER